LARLKGVLVRVKTVYEGVLPVARQVEPAQWLVEPTGRRRKEMG